MSANTQAQNTPRSQRVHPPSEIKDFLAPRPDWAETLTKLSEEIYADNYNKGFWEQRQNLMSAVKMENDPCYDRPATLEFTEAVALIITELAEIIEATRASALEEDFHCPGFSNLEIEFADVFIRLADLAGGCKFRLGQAVKAKLEYNKTRPYMHGKKS